MTIEIFTIIFIFASAYLFYIYSIKRTEKKGGCRNDKT